MPGMEDLARAMAAGGDTGAEAQNEPLENPDQGNPEQPAQTNGYEELEQGIAMIEGALDRLPSDDAEKIRNALEGIKEVSIQAQAGGKGAQEPAAQEPDADDQPGAGGQSAQPGGGSLSGGGY